MEALETWGYYWVRDALSVDAIDALKSAFNTETPSNARLYISSQSESFKSVLDNITRQVNAFLFNPRPVRLVAFNKSDNLNWALSWHQDRIIAVKEKYAIAGYKNWTRKSGIWHCEPPRETLENMLTVRVHLDNANAENGALEVLQQSHKYGKIMQSEISTVTSQCETVPCEAAAGDILIMKMLTLHRSNASISSKPRRALRIDYGNEDLPKPLEWAGTTSSTPAPFGNSS